MIGKIISQLTNHPIKDELQLQSTNNYSQSKAIWAITKASFKAIIGQPAAVFFSLLFPIIFILIFGAFSGGRGGSYAIAMEDGSDTSNAIYGALKGNEAMHLKRYTESEKRESDLQRGQLTAVVGIRKTDSVQGFAGLQVTVRSTSASSNTFPMFMHILEFIKLKYEAGVRRDQAEIVKLETPVITEGQKYRQIDFILPGQIGFSILFATLFGIAFTFYTLREQLVLKRFYASPVKRINILIGIGISRLSFQLLNVIVLILFGHFLLDFTLQRGFITFLEMTLFSIIMLFFLMGVGLIFSSAVKSDSSIPLLINLFGFPQMMLSGTFFPVSVFPAWLQQLSYFLPLTQFNDGMRKISFEGLHLWDCWEQIGILGIWIAITYAILARVIRWE
ncbi:MAG: ABC transporter permease [Chitinophagaceae bacterium]|nr:ABC transporter permease [Chitinophagaceae bacterium]